MNTLFVFFTAFALAAGQVNYDCAVCDSYAEREDRVGCRLWCDVDIQAADDVWSEEEMDLAWTTTWGCGPLGGCDLAAFIAALQDTLQVCEVEVERSFALLKTMDPESNPDLVDLSDMFAWRDIIRNDYNNGGDCTEVAFQGWWAFRYPQLYDPDCPDGL